MSNPSNQKPTAAASSKDKAEKWLSNQDHDHKGASKSKGMRLPFPLSSSSASTTRAGGIHDGDAVSFLRLNGLPPPTDFPIDHTMRAIYQRSKGSNSRVVQPSLKGHDEVVEEHQRNEDKIRIEQEQVKQFAELGDTVRDTEEAHEQMAKDENSTTSTPSAKTTDTPIYNATLPPSTTPTAPELTLGDILSRFEVLDRVGSLLHVFKETPHPDTQTYTLDFARAFEIVETNHFLFTREPGAARDVLTRSVRFRRRQLGMDFRRGLLGGRVVCRWRRCMRVGWRRLRRGLRSLRGRIER